MATVTEGISTGEQVLDPNAQASFDAILEGRGVERTPEDGDTSTDTSIAAGLSTVEPGLGREPNGQFAPATTPKDTSPAAGTDTSTEGDAAVSSDDTEVEAFLAKYGGDVNAAVKAAANQSALLGRQGQELGAERERIAKLEGMVEALIATQTAPAAPVSPLAGLSDDQVDERAQQAVESKGIVQAATEAANIAHTTGDERAYRSIMERWNVEDGFTAMDFHSDFRQWQKDQRAAAQTPAEPEAWVVDAQQTALNNTIEQSFIALATERGGKEAFAPVAAFMDKALDQMPENVAAMIASNDPEARLSGLRIVADRATLLAGAAPAAAVETTETTELPASVQRKLAGAAVATGALKPPAPRAAGTPQTKEEAVTAFKKELLETETTSVAAGLTYAK